MPFPLSEHEIAFVLRHFRKPKPFPWNEQTFLDIIAAPQKKMDCYYAAIALRDCGSASAVPALKSLLTHPMRDVKAVALLTIAHIARESESDFYGALLLDTSFREKTYALWAIADAADVRALPSVLAYLKKNHARVTAGTLPMDSLRHAQTFLIRAGDEENAEVLEWLGAKSPDGGQVSER